MEPIFSCRCNCLYDISNVSTADLERLAEQAPGLGIPFNAATIASSVERIGHWVGGNAHVSHDRVVFSMNRLNAFFMNRLDVFLQEDEEDAVVPSDVVVTASIIGDVRFGKVLKFGKTVDLELMGVMVRFRCNGKNNDRLLEAIRSVINKI